MTSEQQGKRAEGWLTDKEQVVLDAHRVWLSSLIPGHAWDPVGRMCECGAEVGVACDVETVEEHLLAHAGLIVRAEVGQRFADWAAKNEIAEPPLDWAWFGGIVRWTGVGEHKPEPAAALSPAASSGSDDGSAA